MNNRLLELFRLCLKAKTVGIDAFFQYSPHVEMVDCFVYENGWDYVKDENGEDLLDDNGNSVVKDFDKRFYLAADSVNHIDAVILYLTNLIKEKAPQGPASE